MPAQAAITRLTLSGFRNHRASTLAPGDARLVLLTGPNGAGKTNVIEALSLLSPGRGLRGASLGEMAPRGAAGGFRLDASLRPDAGLPAIGVRIETAAQAPGRRQVLIDGAPAPMGRLAEWVALMWITPAMDRLFAEAASQRRRFLDRLVLALEPEHGRHATRYEAALAARNRLLAVEAAPDPAWLSALEDALAREGALVAQARARAVAALNAALKVADAAPFPRPFLALEGDDGGGLAARLAAGRAADRAAGRTLIGPHRQDLAVAKADDGTPAAHASTGEQKALLVAIILAHAALVAEQRERAPLLLMDEAVAHLDADRRAALFGRLSALGGQTWLTGTDRMLFDGLDAARFRVSNGEVSAG